MTDPYPDIVRNVTALGKVECPSCGRGNPIRMNKSHRCFWVCKWPTGDDGSLCRAERRFTDKETVELVRSFNQENLKMKGPKDGTENPDTSATGYSFYK